MSKDPILYLHIGTHKTGTTFLQRVLSNNFDRLLEHGILYPKTCRNVRASDSHARLSPRYKDNKIVESDGWEALYAEIERHRPRKIILSAEDFCRMHTSNVLMRERANWIKNRLPFPTKIIVYLREKESYLVSMYAHKVKKGVETRNFDNFCKEEKYRVDNEKMLEPWRIFDEIIIRDYTDDIMSDFQKIVDLPKLQVPKKRLNVAPSNKAIRVMVIMNRILQKITKPWTIRYWYKKFHLEEICKFLPISNRGFALKK